MLYKLISNNTNSRSGQVEDEVSWNYLENVIYLVWPQLTIHSVALLPFEVLVIVSAPPRKQRMCVC